MSVPTGTPPATRAPEPPVAHALGRSVRRRRAERRPSWYARAVPDEPLDAGRTQQNPTVQPSLSEPAGGCILDSSRVLAGALVSSLPIIAVFLLMGRHPLGGVTQKAMKG